LRNFASVLREISFDDLRDEAERSPVVLIVAPEPEGARALGEALVGRDGTAGVATAAIGERVDTSGRFDAIVVHDPEMTGEVARLRKSAVGEGASPVFSFDAVDVGDANALARLRRSIVTRLPDRAPAFGRAFPLFREAAVKAVIDETARVNAQFALVSNIPAVVPIVGSLAAAGADFLVLTKNQLLLMFKIAAIHGRDLHDQWGVMRELIPVVGAGLLWRTIAREAASFIPLAAGTIPKVAIAYAGTISVGRAADFYYTTNKKPSRQQLRGYYQQAAEAVKHLPLPGQGGDDKQADKDDTEPIPFPSVRSSANGSPIDQPVEADRDQSQPV
jgi:uncharacterized protein (DUF697 family)